MKAKVPKGVGHKRQEGGVPIDTAAVEQQPLQPVNVLLQHCTPLKIEQIVHDTLFEMEGC